MKIFLLTSLLGVAMLAGCESTSVNTASGPRTIDLPGAPSPAVVNYFKSPAYPHGSTNGN